MALYQYAKTDGSLGQFEAADAATAIKSAPGIAKNSGVSLIGQASGSLPASATTPTYTPTTDAKTRSDAFTSTPSPVPVPGNGAVSSSDLSRANSTPDISTYLTAIPKNSLNGMVSSVASTTLDSTGKAIDVLRAKQQAQVEADKAAEQSQVDALGRSITKISKSTAAQDALAATRDKFHVDQTIAQLEDIQQKIVGAQEALNMGLIYEGDRPVRMSLLSGRQATLQKQGLATIGALQSTAQVLQGNIDLAESYAKATVDAIQTDNANAMTALQTLLTLHQNNLVDLTDEERKIVDSRIGALQDEDKEIKSNADDVFKLMSDYPSAALAGGVTLLDNRETAIKKMLPKMSSMETLKFNADLASKASTTTDKDGSEANKTTLLSYKANGMPYEDAVTRFGNVLSLDWINQAYGRAAPKATSGADAVKDQYYSGFFNADGTLKPGVSIDAKGNPQIAGQSKSIGESIGGFFGNLVKGFTNNS